MFSSRVVMAALLLLMVVGAGCKPGQVSKQVQAQLDQKDDRISQLEKKAEVKDDRLEAMQRQGQIMEDSLGRIIYQLSTSERKVLRLQSEKNQMREAFSEAVDQIEDRRIATDSTLAEVRRELGRTQRTLLSFADQHQAYLGQMSEWRLKLDEHFKWDDYHRHEGGRNWAKKLFGIDAMPRPDTVEHVLPEPPIFEFKAP